MVDIGPGHALHGISVIPDEQNDRHAVTKSAVNRHRGVLQADRAVCVNRHGFAFNLEVTVCHCNGSLFMKAGQKLRVAVHSIINGGFMQTAVTGARIGGDIFEPEGFDHIEHEVRPGPDRSQRPRDFA